MGADGTGGAASEESAEGSSASMFPGRSASALATDASIGGVKLVVAFASHRGAVEDIVADVLAPASSDAGAAMTQAVDVLHDFERQPQAAK